MQKNSRAEEMMALSKAGYTQQEIATMFNLSKQRVCQILQKHFPYSEKILRGAGIRKRMTIDAETQARLDWAKEKWGIVPHGLRSVEQQAQFDYFRRLKQNARTRKIEFTIKFDDVAWPSICPETGKEIDWFASTITDASPACRRLDKSMGYVPGNVQIMSWEGYRKYIWVKH